MVRIKRITRQRLDPQAVMASVGSGTAGGTVVFIGTVRNHNGGKKVRFLEYEVYRGMAEKRMKAIESEVKRKWPGSRIAMAHREGRLAVGDVSVVVAVSAGHRAEAFTACRYAIDKVKVGLPLWKREIGYDGKGDWVKGSPIAD